MSKHEDGPPTEISPKLKLANTAWENYEKSLSSGSTPDKKVMWLRTAVQAEIDHRIEECVEEPSRKDLHQGDLGPAGPIGTASILSLMALYGETGVNERQWKALVHRLYRAEQGHPLVVHHRTRLTWDELQERVRSQEPSATAKKWFSTIHGFSPPHVLHAIATAFDAGQLWAEADRCPDCLGRSHSQEECPAHEEPQRNPFTPGPRPDAPQCTTTTHDRASGNQTQCRLRAGHERHDDGCLSWLDGPSVALQEAMTIAKSRVQYMEAAEKSAQAVLAARQHAGDAMRRVEQAAADAGALLPELLKAIEAFFHG